MKNLKVQKIAKPKQIFLPKRLLLKSSPEVKQRIPIKKTVNAKKKVWITIISALIKLKDFKSFSQLKYLGKMTWIKANKINEIPISLRCISMRCQNKKRNKWVEFFFILDG